MMNPSTTIPQGPQVAGLKFFDFDPSRVPNSPIDSGAQMLALSSGEFHGMIMQRFKQAYLEAGKDRRRFTTEQIGCLRDYGLINKQEQQTLSRVFQLAIAVDQSRGEGHELIQELRTIYEVALAEGASDMTIAIIGITLNSAGNSMQWYKDHPNTETAHSDAGPAESDAEGGIWGAAAGAGAGLAAAGVGALAGGLLGGIYGAAGASLAYALDQL
ncbi:MAG: hypothetical protein AAGG75_04140 [Bacteroidota bacterium]